MSQREKSPFSPAAQRTRLSALANEFAFARAFTIGKSLCSRPIVSLHIGCGKKTLLYVGGHHGSEYLTSLLLCDFAEELCRAVNAGERRFGFFVREALERRTLILLPALNPDGEAIALSGTEAEPSLQSRLLSLNNGSDDFTHWQANARGVDLNHNYDYGFTAYKALEAREGIVAGPTRYAGEFPESEPETAALCRLIGETADRLSVILSFHTQGEEIFYHESPRTHGGACFLSRASGYRLSQASGLAAFGGLTDWADTLGIPAYTIEAGKGQNPLPVSCRGYLYARLRELLFTSLLYF